MYVPRNRWKAVVQRDGDTLVKDYGGSPLIARLYGRVCLHWEEVALRRLAGVEGVPAFVDRPGRYSLRMTIVPGAPLARFERGDLAPGFMERLESLFAQMHARGVAHGDAHKRNILVHEEKPYVVDFSTAYAAGRVPLLDGTLFRWFVLLDQERLYKVRKMFFEGGPPPRMFFLYRLLKRLKRWTKRSSGRH